jgi:hypothetical protein
MKRTFENDMEKFRKMIYGIVDNASIKERIALIYNEERLAAGQALYMATKEAAESQLIEKIEANEAISQFNQTKEEIHQALVKYRRVARYLFKNNLSIQKTLLLDNDIPASYAAWKSLSQNTFNAIKTDASIIEKFALVGITSEEIDGFVSNTNGLDQLQLAAEKEDGEAQQASLKKQETFNELKAYCSDLYECLNLFYLGSERQKLEEIGIIVK